MTLIVARPERKVRLTDDGVHRFDFPEGCVVPSGPYRVMGGLAWPEAMSGALGVALVMGYEIKTSTAWVLAEHEFSLIEPMGSDAGVDPVPYLADFLNRGWADYGCGTWHWWGGTGDFMTQVRGVLCSKAVNPKPDLPYVEWLDEERAATTIYRWDESGKLKMAGSEDGGILHRSLADHEAMRGAGDGRSAMNPGIWAAGAALAAFDLIWLGRKHATAKRPEQRASGFEGLV